MERKDPRSTAVSDLADAIATPLASGYGSVSLVFGVVTVTGTGGLTTVTVSGDPTAISGVKVLNAANPTAGATVAILRSGTDLLVLGTV